MIEVRVRPHPLFDEGWETISLGTFVGGWLRAFGVSSARVAPPVWMFRVAQLRSSQFVAKIGDSRWAAAPFEISELDYRTACAEIGVEVVAAEPWMVNVGDFVRHVRAQTRPGLIPAMTFRRLRNKDFYLVSLGARMSEQGDDVVRGLPNALLHVRHTFIRYGRHFALEAKADRVPMGLAFAEVRSTSDLGVYRAPDLCGASVRCDVDGVDLRGADIRAADFRDAHNLDRAQLRGAWFDLETRFPAGFDAVAAGAIAGSPVGEPVTPLDLPINFRVIDPDGQRSDLSSAERSG